MYITTHEKLKLLVFQNFVKWKSPEWNSYQTVLRNRSQLIFKNKGEVWFFLFFYCENTFSVTNTHFTPDKKSFKWVPHTALIWHWKTPLGIKFINSISLWCQEWLVIWSIIHCWMTLKQLNYRSIQINIRPLSHSNIYT